ncbi:hypothetical protein AAF712_014816 [Marasmius tenuissimus]|uniref:Uncharacterized protein n=1 Tax=Marasmius tenuissimus TaxID=585030 RepID=A0ABR2ZC28_9AGAR
MRDRHYRIEDRTQSWNRQLPRLTNAYLKFHSTGILEDEELEGDPWKILLADIEDYQATPVYALFVAQRRQTRPSLDLACLEEVLTSRPLHFPSNSSSHFVKSTAYVHDLASTDFLGLSPTYTGDFPPLHWKINSEFHMTLI